MKNKSTRHKEFNTFKFQPFAERIANIDVDVIHRVEHEYETESDDVQCHFYQAVEKWNLLNLTKGFGEFRREVKAYSLVTLPQLILNKDNVVEILLKHLKLRDPLCLQPLLDIVVSLAKDLRKSFYPHYKEFLEVLISLLNTKDTDQLEWTFTCLAYIFKFLWRPILKEITSVFNSLLPLLSDNRPEYINNFAAESFAFVARKVRDRETFLVHILKTVHNKKDGVDGCGRLFFEIIHGITGQFHSCAETLLPFWFESLSNEKTPQSTLYEILEQLVNNIVCNIEPQKSGLLWESLLKTLESFDKKFALTPSDLNSTSIELILKLLGQSIEYRSGKLLKDPNQVITKTVEMLGNPNLPENVLQVVVQISISLLLATNLKLTQEQASRITRNVLNLKNKKLLLYFVENSTTFSSFEPLILPTFLKFCVSSDSLDSDSFKVLTRVLLEKAPPCESGINLPKWQKYSLDFGSKSNNILVENCLKGFLTNPNLDKVDYVSSLICLPHVNVSDVEDLSKILIENVLKITNDLKNSSESLRKPLFLLNYTVECLEHLGKSSELLAHFNFLCEILLPLCSDEDTLTALKTLDLIVTNFRDDNEVIKMSTLETLDQVLAHNFTSPYREIRLLTSHLYTFFEDLPEFAVLKHSTDPEIPDEKFAVFSICFQVESIESQVQTYREQIRNLDRLTWDKPQIIMCYQTKFKTLPLRYLCGTLYINFKLLWEPVMKIIESHAHGLLIEEFWGIYGLELKKVVANIRQVKEKDVDVVALDFIGDLYQKSCQLETKPDFFNYRLLLWKTMAAFTDVGEAKTRDVSVLLLNFIQDEYLKNDSDMALMWNIKQNSPLPVDELDVKDPENEEKSPKVDEHQRKRGKSGEKSNLQSLLSFLAVFSKIRSPLSMYREPELSKLYLDLLQHKNPEVQKIALDCIMTYKHKYLTPYKESLYKLIDDKSFKDELTAFQIDKDASKILQEHRSELIPIVLKIVFSKMSAKTGMRTGGKSSSQFRRTVILRFIAGCQEDEMLTFIKMAFKFYSKFLSNEDSTTITDDLSSDLSLDKFIPPKRLQSALNLLDIVLEQFGGLMGVETLSFVYRVILIIGAAIKFALDNSEQVHAGYYTILRTLRNSALKTVTKFFTHFDSYPWSSREIDSTFKVFVWPYLDKLEIEGIHSPTAFLKLIVQWGSNPKFFPLLNKYKDDDVNCSVIPHVVNLLLNEKSNITVVNIIEEMIEKLVSLEMDNQKETELEVSNVLPIRKEILERVKLDGKLNYGSCILLPFVPKILEKIRRKLGSKTKSLNQRELFILARISELVWEAEISDDTLSLLLPVVLKKSSGGSGEEVIVNFLTTVENLIGNIVDPLAHSKLISPLFGEVSYSSGRKRLISTLKTITSRANLPKTFELVEGLNAFDVKWVDQPDFQRRHDTFKLITQSIEEDSVDHLLGVLLIYNCFHLLKSEKDLSLKENSSYCLKSLSVFLINKYQKDSKILDYVLNETILSLIRNGMRSKNQDFRYECINLLGHLARGCPESHLILRDLNKYTNKIDSEVDVFENLTHLQLHRHARALLKLSQINGDLTQSPNVRSLTQFVLPLVTFYLCNDKYLGKNSLIDAAVECLGTICKILPWHQYESVLKFYLLELRRKKEYQKQLVKLTVSVLDAFHFDLSKANAMINEVQSQETEVETSKLEEISEDDNNELIIDDDEEIIEDEDVVTEDVEKVQDLVKVCEKTTILCKSTATRVIKTIELVLLPQLHKSLAELTHHESSHKLNRKRTSMEREEEELSRVPISLALVKLLQRLPESILKSNLPGVFMKMCTFLKSPLESVRRMTRDTLQKIMITLGPDYLNLLLREMTPLLSRGFQVHVLVFTTHAVLSCLRESYRPTDIDKVLLTVIDLCTADLFGTLSEEKEVAKIAVKTSEAKSTKSFDTFQILAQYITEKCLTDLILPIRRVLATSHSHKTVFKAQECLRHIALGLVDNVFIPTESLVKFAYGTASESIPELLTTTSGNTGDKFKKATEKLKFNKPDCFIIPKNPVGRSGFRLSNVKSSAKTNAHLLVEFGLRLCYVLLKRDKLRDDDFKPFLDPFVAVFRNCLNSKHIKLSTLTLQCLTWIMKLELPSMKENIEDIAKEMFAILHKYAAAGLSKGDNFDLVVASFKAMSVLVRDVKYYAISSDQLKILLLYAEQDMHDHDRQATAFNMLKAIIARKLIVPEIHEVMEKVAELSIISELNYVRNQSRAVFHQYLMDYPLGNTFEKHLSFFISQLNYEMQFGRKSAIEMLQTLILTFPVKVLKDNCGTLMVTLGARLINDEDPECRKMVSDCISSMLSRLTKPQREPLFDIVIVWFRDKNVNHRRLAAQLCGIFVTVEKLAFESRIEKIVPLVLYQFANYNKKKDDINDEDDEEIRVEDHHLFQTLQLLLKLSANCPSFLKENKDVGNLAQHAQKLLGYPHNWVRLSAAQFLGYVLSATDVDNLADLVASDSKSDQTTKYLYVNPIESIKSLSLDLCDQLQPGVVNSDLAEQVVKNLVFVARVLRKLPETGDKIHLLWLVKRLRKVVNTEVVEAPSSGVLRTEVFKWVGGVATVLDGDSLKSVLNHLLAPLVREMITTEESNAPLRQLAKEVAGILKKKVGLDYYTETLSGLQRSLSVKRAERKRARTQLAVTDPEVYAKKKIKRHEKKKVLKRKVMADRKGKKTFKRRKTAIDLDTEEII